MEERLFQWIVDRSRQQWRVSSQKIKLKAREMSEDPFFANGG